MSNEEAVRYSLFKRKPLSTEKKAAVKKEKGKPLAKSGNSPLPVKSNIEQVVKLDDLLAVPLPGFPHYYITPCSKVYSKDRLLRPQQQAGKAARVKVKSSIGILERHTVSWLLATTFLPNPRTIRKLYSRTRTKATCL